MGFIGCLREQYLLDGLLQALLTHEPGGNLGLVFHGAEEQGGNALYPEQRSQLRLLVDIDFIDIDFPGIFGGNLIEYGGQLAAGSAPAGVEIDDTGAGSQIFPAVGGLLEINHFREKLGLGELAGLYRLHLCVLFLLGGLFLGLAREECRQAGQGDSQDVFHFHIGCNLRV